MAWDFSTDPEFEKKLDWVRTVRSGGGRAARPALARRRLQATDRRPAPHPEPLEAAGAGPGSVGRAPRSRPRRPGLRTGEARAAERDPRRDVVGPDASSVRRPPTPATPRSSPHYGTEEQKAKYLQPLLEGEIVSCYSMTEPQGGSDPEQFETSARARRRRVGHQRLEVLLVTRPLGRVPHRAWRSPNPTPRSTTACRCSSSRATPPGSTIVRNIGISGESEEEGGHGLVHYDNVRVPAENLLGEPGDGFGVAQTRLGGGRVHHAMRAVGICQKAFDMMCERALSRVRPAASGSPTSSTCRDTSPTPGPSSSSTGSWCCRPPGRSTSTTTTSGSAKTSPRSRSSPPS